MDVNRIKEIQKQIEDHQRRVGTPQMPAGHNVRDEDLSKVASNERIGKAEHESDLRK